jgi:hypothetical protein
MAVAMGGQRTMELHFRKALKHGAKRVWTIGSGKTYMLLTLATGLGRPIALLETEHGSASKYADIFEFDVPLQVSASAVW